ncbi:MAG: hypothetical protein MUR46_00400 [Loktanella sp.]|jgi:hypothetical protein|nr:hypothetical protein [Amylibacter sp.]MDO7556252.1 hypothetical protein [Loktanella sp.]MDO7607579.1 hypothetical protein [Loktanella sp.]MDO7622556.1 hypothetical protein [Loktanella sp.]MDO7626249.1 hypothetical protein [Loktanella sp.]
MLRVIPFLCCMCASYAAADDCNKLSTTDFPTGSIEEFKAELIGSTSNAEAFKDVWTKYTFHVGPGRQNPLFHLLLGYQAFEMGQPFWAITNLETASIKLNQANICDDDLVQFFIYVGRRYALATIFDEYVDVPFEMLPDFYGAATKGVHYPLDWLSDYDLPLVKCILYKMDFSQADQLDRSITRECR